LNAVIQLLAYFIPDPFAHIRGSVAGPRSWELSPQSQDKTPAVLAQVVTARFLAMPFKNNKLLWTYDIITYFCFVHCLPFSNQCFQSPSSLCKPTGKRRSCTEHATNARRIWSAATEVWEECCPSSHIGWRCFVGCWSRLASPGVLCRICRTAHDQHLLTDGVVDRRQEDAFISSVMNNWKRALEKIQSTRQNALSRVRDWPVVASEVCWTCICTAEPAGGRWTSGGWAGVASDNHFHPLPRSTMHGCAWSWKWRGNPNLYLGFGKTRRQECTRQPQS